MGLDMYLSAKKYVPQVDYANEGKPNPVFDEIIKQMNAENFVGGFVPNVQVEVSVAYWRKANQIHNWFVQNCADGEDNCQPVFVNREELENLLKTCKEVYASKTEEKAEELLAPTLGFFFGSYEVDEWYWQQIEETINTLEKVLENVPQDWDFEYQASW